MKQFAVVAHRVTPTNTRLGQVLSPAQALRRLWPGDVALGRLDVLPSLDGIEPGLWTLERLETLGVTVLNGRRALSTAHDKLATAAALGAVRIPHPRTGHVAPWLPFPDVDPPLVLKPRFGSWGRDVVACETWEDVERALVELVECDWYRATGAIAQRLVEPQGFDLRIVVACGQVIGAIRRVAAPGEWRTNVALGGHREPVVPPADACELALAAAHAIGGDLVGVDLLPAGVGTWVVLELNGAVDFSGAYSLDEEVFEATRGALFRLPGARLECGEAPALAP